MKNIPEWKSETIFFKFKYIFILKYKKKTQKDIFFSGLKTTFSSPIKHKQKSICYIRFNRLKMIKIQFYIFN